MPSGSGELFDGESGDALGEPVTRMHREPIGADRAGIGLDGERFECARKGADDGRDDLVQLAGVVDGVAQDDPKRSVFQSPDLARIHEVAGWLPLVSRCQASRSRSPLSSLGLIGAGALTRSSRLR